MSALRVSLTGQGREKNPHVLCRYEHLRYVALSSGAWLSFQRPLLAQNYAFAAEYILSISVMFVDFGPDFLHSCFSS